MIEHLCDLGGLCLRQTKAAGPMIPIDKERRALRLLAAERFSQRAIAHAVGISRGTVGTLKRLGHERPRPEKRIRMLEARPEGPVERCPGCRRLIKMPCLACEAEEYRLAKKSGQDSQDAARTSPSPACGFAQKAD